jgi:hypothetical protein
MARSADGIANRGSAIVTDNSGKRASYGLAIGVSNGSTFLYAAYFAAGTVEVYNSGFRRRCERGVFHSGNSRA